MQPMIADLLTAPWAMLPDRLPFVRAALLDAHSGGQHAALQARTNAATKDAARRRQADNGSSPSCRSLASPCNVPSRMAKRSAC